MRKLMGVWVCQNRAVIVRLDERNATTVTLMADVAPKSRATGGTGSGHPFMHCSVSSRDRLDATRDAAIGRFLGDIAKAVEPADEIVIMGPGKAKVVLANRLTESGAKVIAIEPAGSRLTDAQIAARVMKIFGRPAPRMARQVPGLAVPI